MLSFLFFFFFLLLVKTRAVVVERNTRADKDKPRQRQREMEENAPPSDKSCHQKRKKSGQVVRWRDGRQTGGQSGDERRMKGENESALTDCV